ncbi:MAG TPA: SH3 domain-containing protein [Nocardioides sp.]|nr:SH3 domain-containing protein [Nocardioides sp.]
MPSLAAAVVTSTVVGVSVAASDVTAVSDEPAFSAHLIQKADPLVAADQFADREQRVSRAAPRTTIVDLPEPVGHRFATAPLKLRLEPSEKAKDAGVVDELTKLFITGEAKGGYTQVLLEDKLFWVSSEYLAKKKPEPEVSAAGAALPVGDCTAAPPSGVTANAMAVYEAVCARFPQVTTYGGYRGDGEHSDGRAIDIMVSGELGWDIANYLLANAGTFGLYDIIYSQRIWTDERSSEGWRYMEDRGSATANHYDHVHVKVY